MKKSSLVFLLVLLTNLPLFATTYTSDGSMTNVNSLIASATSGDTITVPAGPLTWGASGSTITLNKAVHLTGLNTALTLSTTGPTFGNGVITVTNGGIVDGTWTITGALNGTAVTPFSISGLNIVITGITYNAPNTNGGYFVYVSDATGVCYNCTINDTFSTGTLQTFMVRGNNSRWSVANTIGTSNTWFVEDCTINSAYAQENDGCAASVIRFNTLGNAATLDAHFIETSTSTSGTSHGNRQLEGYNNIYTGTGNGVQWCRAQGGTVMIFDNVIPSIAGSGGATHFYALIMEWGANTGIFTPGLSSVPTPAGYPIPDQIGIGPYNPTQAGGAEPMYYFNNREKDGTDNPLLGFTVAASAITAYGATFYQTSMDGSPYMYLRGREFFKGVADGAFPSVSDVGYGTHAQMLASSPTAAGQGWFATDDGTWYQKWAGSKAATAITAGDRCQIATVGSTSFTSIGASANTVGTVFIAQSSGSGTGTVTPVSGKLWQWSGSAWVSFYEPYTYPHPLRGAIITASGSSRGGVATSGGKSSSL